VEGIHMDFPKGSWPGKVWNIPITPKMKEELLTRGIETFAHGGFIDKPFYDRAV